MPYDTSPKLPEIRMKAVLLLRKGWSSRKVARHTGFSQSAVVKWSTDSGKHTHDSYTNASLTVQEFEEACGSSKVSVFYPLGFSRENLKAHEAEIEADAVKEFRLSSLFSVYVIEKA